MARTGEPIEIHSAFRFTVEIDGIAYAAFTECTLPNLEVETLEVKEGGHNEYTHKLPMRVKTGNITLRHGITKGVDLLKWYLQILQGQISDATRQVSVVMYGHLAAEQKIGPVVRWNFEKAYPVRWTGPTLKTDDAALAIEVLELAHHGFTVQVAG